LKIILAVALAVLDASAQSKTPHFQDYPVIESFEGSPASVVRGDR